MPAFSTFLRRTPPNLLRRWLARHIPNWEPSSGWDAPTPELSKAITLALKGADVAVREKVLVEAERIGDMADEAGQNALLSFCADRAAFSALAGGFARATALFIEDPEAFRRAERARFADDLRRGRLWTAFRGEPGLKVRRTPAARNAFLTALKSRFDSPNAYVEVHDRERPAHEDSPEGFVQAVIYREGRIDEVPVFEDGILGHRPARPVVEAAVTYEFASGIVEVVGADAEGRRDLAAMFAEHLLEGGRFGGQRFGGRVYDLRSLLRRRAFEAEPSDGIAVVRVVMLRLAPLGSGAERLTLETTRAASTDIWEMAAFHFGERDPLRSGWTVTQARLSIELQPGPGGRPPKVLLVTISPPHRCDLKERTSAERIIGVKYLRRWGLVVDA